MNEEEGLQQENKQQNKQNKLLKAPQKSFSPLVASAGIPPTKILLENLNTIIIESNKK